MRILPPASVPMTLRNSVAVPILKTDRLILREVMLEDAEFILRLLNEPSYLRFIGDKGVRTVAEARDFIEAAFLKSYERFGFGLYLTETKDDRAPIGICGLVKRDTLEDVDIGFAFVPEFWANGYAYESAKAVLSYARDHVGLKRIAGVTQPDNPGSIRTLEKLGLRYQRMIRLSDDAEEIQLYVREL